jgi:hypothetical protein
VTLGNFPDSLRNFTRPNGNHIDLAAIDLLRDRERGIPCYNDFREFLGRSRVKSFEELLGGPPAPGDEAARRRYEKYLPRLKALYKDASTARPADRPASRAAGQGAWVQRDGFISLFPHGIPAFEERPLHYR